MLTSVLTFGIVNIFICCCNNAHLLRRTHIHKNRATFLQLEIASTRLVLRLPHTHTHNGSRFLVHHICKLAVLSLSHRRTHMHGFAKLSVCVSVCFLHQAAFSFLRCGDARLYYTCSAEFQFLQRLLHKHRERRKTDSSDVV